LGKNGGGKLTCFGKTREIADERRLFSPGNDEDLLEDNALYD